MFACAATGRGSAARGRSIALFGRCFFTSMLSVFPYEEVDCWRFLTSHWSNA